MAPKGRSSQKKAPRRTHVRMLFTCIGRRVELLRAFRRAGQLLGIRLDIHGADANRLSPAMHLVDKAHLVPSISGGDYIDALLRLVQRHKIELLIPLLDLELTAIAQAAGRFEQVGCRALVSSERVVRTCRDKLATFDALKKAGIDTPRTRAWSDAVNRKRHRFPYFLKPRRGSAGMGNYIVLNIDELRTFGLRVHDAIVQEFVEGVEYTLDVYTGFDGNPRAVVPRKRLEVRTGEVSKAVIVKDPAIMAVGRAVAEALGECRGIITVQCIVTPEKRIRVIEINPRFGGGVPLSINAGADSPKWILMELLGQKPRINPTAFRDDVAMLRFDDSVFVPRASRGSTKMIFVPTSVRYGRIRAVAVIKTPGPGDQDRVAQRNPSPEMPTALAVIFDLDDTLYPERAFAFSGFAAVADAFRDVLSGPAEAAARMGQLFDTEHRRRVFNTVLAERGVEPDEQLINRMIETYRAHRPRIALHRDADGVLTRFAGDRKLGLITDGPAIMQRNKIEALVLSPRFDEIIPTDELAEGCAKPHPRAFELMSKRLAVEPARCVYVADNPAKDFLAPNALGWQTIQIKRKDGIYRSEPYPEPGQPGHVIDTLDALDALLQS